MKGKLAIWLGASMALALIGLVIDLNWGFDAFPRSGALIVAAGVALAGREIHRGERSIARNEARVEKLEAAILDAAGDRTASDASPETFTRLAASLADFREQRLIQVGQMINAEIVIVCIGTLIWGFGDLLV